MVLRVANPDLEGAPPLVVASWSRDADIIVAGTATPHCSDNYVTGWVYCASERTRAAAARLFSLFVSE